jgi:crossover junction endodeoxyribonuclease RuvC
MIILGIDPGLRVTGYGCVRVSGSPVAVMEAGVIRTTEGRDLGFRLQELAAGLGQVLESVRPEVVVVESLYSHYKHPPTAILMGHARGVILYSAVSRGVPVINYPATRIKKSLTGNGRASKLQMQRSIMSTLKMDKLPEPADVADALAVALCHANVLHHEGLVARGSAR